MGPRLGRTTGLDERMLQQAADWYAANPIPRSFRHVDPRVLAKVQALSGGDWRRCVINEDGSVTVHNQRMWART